MYDQEPVDFNSINISPEGYKLGIEHRTNYDLYNNLSKEDFIFNHASAVYTPIICHSEKNSPEIAKFKKNHYSDVHYWWHGLISRDWFRYWRHYNRRYNEKSKRFGIYARDATGSRKYRINVLDRLTEFNKHIHYSIRPLIKQQIIEANKLGILSKWSCVNTDISSDASAQIDWGDCPLFDIQIVPETLFDTEKIHLTEKIFKPIVMYQPFILFSGPNGLQYLRDYGFKTFDGIWDESYDLETNSDRRFNKIINLIRNISNLNTNDYQKLINKTISIVEHNRKHFYSQEFEDILLNELYNGIDVALQEQQQKFYNMPGGTWFYYLNKLYEMGLDISNINRGNIIKILSYMKLRHPTITRDIIKKYNHLF